MAHKKDFIPTKDADFDVFFRDYCQYVNAKCSPPDAPQWGHIPANRLTELNDAYTDWHVAYVKLAKAHTSSDVLAKNLARKQDEKVLRIFNNEFILYSSVVTPQEKQDLGNKPRDEHPTPVPKPTSQPEADIVLPGIHMVELVNIRRVPGIGNDDPRSDYGVRIHFGILDAGPSASQTEPGKFGISLPPKSGDDLPYSDFTRKKKYLFDFAEEDRGKTVYFCLLYENSKGGREGKGPWGPILSAIIP